VHPRRNGLLQLVQLIVERRVELVVVER